MDFDLVKLYSTLGIGGLGVIVMVGITIYLIKYVLGTQERLVDALDSNAIALTSIVETLRTLNNTINNDAREARLKRNVIENRLVRIDTRLINYNMDKGRRDS